MKKHISFIKILSAVLITIFFVSISFSQAQKIKNLEIFNKHSELKNKSIFITSQYIKSTGKFNIFLINNSNDTITVESFSSRKLNFIKEAKNGNGAWKPIRAYSFHCTYSEQKK